MATNIIMPALGMAQETGKVLRWLKAEGEAVKQGEPLLEIETDKANVELEAPASGVLAAVAAAAGDTVPVGQVIGLILAAGEAPGHAAAPKAVRPPDSGRIAASPKARRLARERGVDLATVAGSIPTGSGPGGAILAADLQAAQSPAAPMSATWRLMAERTAQSWTTVPHFFLFREVDAGRLVAWRAHHEQRASVEVTYSDLLVKLTAAALQKHPRVNARWENGAVIFNSAINIGLAVAIDDGLVVTVIHGADGLSVDDIAARRADLVTRARAGKLRPDDLRGGTFTISNLGMHAVDGFVAIVNTPQAAILAVGRIVQRVVPVGGAPAIRPILALSLSCDHRIVDGARGAQFLETLATLIEDPLGVLE